MTNNRYRAKQDDKVIQYTSEVSDFIDSQYQLYYRSEINFWDGGLRPPHPPAGALPQTLSLWRGRSLYAFNHNIYAQKP